MYKKETARITFVLEMIDKIEVVCQRHNGVEAALDDEYEGRAAVLMFLMQIGETLQKLDADLREKYGLKEEIKGAYDVRNFIAHNYEGVNIALIEEILHDNIPALKVKMQQILHDLSAKRS